MKFSSVGGVAALTLALTLTDCAHNKQSSTEQTRTPGPHASAAPLLSRLGMLDEAAQTLVTASPSEQARASVDEIANAWPSIRSSLVGSGALRNDLIAVDSALHSLKSASSAGAAEDRAANGVTAALAPLYRVAGDKIPPRIHRLDYLQRAIAIDVAELDWVRANGDAISARAAWRDVRDNSSRFHAEQQFKRYARALNAIEDAILSQNVARCETALHQADLSLAAVEKAIDRKDPPWRHIFGNIGR